MPNNKGSQIIAIADCGVLPWVRKHHEKKIVMGERNSEGRKVAIEDRKQRRGKGTTGKVKLPWSGGNCSGRAEFAMGMSERELQR